MLSMDEELRAELEDLFMRHAEEIAHLKGIRTCDERIDGLVSVMRDVYMSSSLCTVDGVLMYYDGFHYRHIDRKTLAVGTNNVLISCGIGATDIRRMGDMAIDVLALKKRKREKYKLGFRNCVYDLRKDEMLAFSRDNIIDYVLPYNFDPEAECVQWLTFLDEVLPDDNMKANLQEFFAMCFIDRKKISVEKMAILVGAGANGKSVIFDVMKHVIGEERMGYLTPSQLIDPKQIVLLSDKTMNFSPDVQASSAFDSTLKAMISSQEVNGWELYKGNTIVRCPPLAFALNELPFFNDVTAAFFRRILLFPFDIVIPEYRQDRMLATRIVTEEISGVFNWVMEGRKRLLKNKGMFTDNPAMIRRLNLLRANVMKSQHPLLRWLDIMGWSTKPLYIGHMPEIVSVRDIYNWLDGAISKENIIKEMAEMNTDVAKKQVTTMSYYLYKNEEVETL